MSVRDLFRRREAAQETAAEAEDVLLKALMNDEVITREKALTLPAVSSAADFICGAIASMPVRLYRRRDGKVENLEDDPRVRFLNGDTGDTLDACQMKRAAVEDYLLDGGGYIYIRRRGNEVTGLFYVRGSDVSVQKNDDPIFKDYLLSVGGKNYRPWDFIKLLRNTRDGASGTGLTEEVGKALETAYRMLLYQLGIARTGGGKRGFLKSQSRLTPEAIEALKKAWREMYEEKTENVIVLNNGLEFQEAAASSTEMQLNQSKNALTGEFNALFHIYPADFERTFKEAIYPIVRAFETALDRDLLLESEKESCFFEFDFKEIVKVSIKDRYQAYKLAKETGFMTINEIRRAENLEYVEGMDVVNVGLSAVLFDTVNHVFFTPNTGTVSDLDDVQSAGEEPAAGGGQPPAVSGQPSAVQPSAVSGQPSAGTGQSAAVEGVLPAPVKAEPKRPAEKRPGADQKKPVPAKETAKREDGTDADDTQPEFAEAQPEFAEAQPVADKERFNPHHGWHGYFASADGAGGGGGNGSGSHGKPDAEKTAGDGSPSQEKKIKSRRGRDVTDEYKKNARPGVGSVTREAGYKQANNEIAIAEMLVRKQGGDIVLLKKKEGYKTLSPDYRWNGRLWDLKRASSASSVDSSVRHALKQINDDPGGIILDFGNKNIPLSEIVPKLDYRIGRSKRYFKPVDVIIIKNDDIGAVLRYE